MKSIAFVILCLLATAAFADPVELAYDSGNRAGHFDQANPGDIEGVRFTPEHPCVLLSFRFYPINTGSMEWHVWGDNGGNMPDVENDLIEPIMVNVDSDFDWIEVDLADYDLHFDVPRHFHIGYIKQGNEPDLMVDGGNNFEERSWLRIANTWYITGEGSGNYLLRAMVDYTDMLEEDEFIFSNVTNAAGLGSMSRVAWGDYDNDGWEDLLVNGNRLYRNLGDGTFDDVTREVGIAENNPANSGAWGDFDNDGWLDFYATNSLLNGDDRLYRNTGEGVFEEVARDYWLFNGDDETQAAGWGDIDADGYLDLYVANSETWNNQDPNSSIYYPDHLFHFNPMDEIFEDVTPADIRNNRHYGRGVAWCDFDQDGDMDVYISNYRLHPNYLLVNDGTGDFSNLAAARGVEGVRIQSAYGHTIGSAWADYDNDLDFDLLAVNLAHPRFLSFSDKSMLYRNNGAPNWDFTDAREDAGIAYDETASSPAWGDYDNDGWLDLFVTSVYEGRQPYLYHNNGDGTFGNVNYIAGFHKRGYNSWGVAWCDYDQDGDLDLALGGPHGGLFRNNLVEHTGAIGKYLDVELVGTESNRFAYGAQAVVRHNGLRMLRQVEGSMGTGSCQNSNLLHFGLGGSMFTEEFRIVEELVITWVGGSRERYVDIPWGHYTAVEGEGLFAGDTRNELPHSFNLSEPYPNPFNSMVRMEIKTPQDGHIKLDVYDSSGRLVTRLADAAYAAGDHLLTWDASGFPAGSYLIQARQGGNVVSHTVKLVK